LPVETEQRRSIRRVPEASERHQVVLTTTRVRTPPQPVSQRKSGRFAVQPTERNRSGAPPAEAPPEGR
jgi:hypothetical protein